MSNEDSTLAREAAPPLAGGTVDLPRDRLWTVHQAAAFLGVSPSWVYKAAERGALPRARGLGWQLRFLPADMEAFARGDASRHADVLPLRAKGGA